MQIAEIIDNFSVLDDWEDRYRYLIDLGRELEPLTDVEHAPAYKVRGCASQVWLITETHGQGPEAVLKFRGDSDALIVRGLIAVLFALYSGKKAGEIVGTDEKAVLRAAWPQQPLDGPALERACLHGRPHQGGCHGHGVPRRSAGGAVGRAATPYICGVIPRRCTVRPAWRPRSTAADACG